MSLEQGHSHVVAAPSAFDLASRSGKGAARESGEKAIARLIAYGHGRYIALPPHTTYALLESPTVVGVPGAARYACGLLSWQGARLPLLDLEVLLHPAASEGAPEPPRYALVVAYQSFPRGPVAYGAIALTELPQTIAVGDDAQCPLPSDSDLWARLSLSCFHHQGRAVPILDTARVFADSHT